MRELEREAVGFPQGRPGNDRHREVQVSLQAANDGELLVVLLAEHGHIRLDDIEQPADHGRHAVEMAGAKLATQDRGQPRHGYDRAGILDPRIHLIDRGRKQQVGTGTRQPAAVMVERARIGLEVLAGAELGRIDEDD